MLHSKDCLVKWLQTWYIHKSGHDEVKWPSALLVKEMKKQMWPYYQILISSILTMKEDLTVVTPKNNMTHIWKLPTPNNDWDRIDFQMITGAFQSSDTKQLKYFLHIQTSLLDQNKNLQAFCRNKPFFRQHYSIHKWECQISVITNFP